MRIHHRLSLSVHDDNINLKFKKIGIPLIDDSMFDIFGIYEDDEKWKYVPDLLLSCKRGEDGYPKYLDLITTSFTHTELVKANYCRMNCILPQQYPLPRSSIPKIFSQTYDGKGCLYCGTEYKQAAPFRIQKEPSWRSKKKHFFRLNWIPGELFIKKENWEQYLKPMDIKANPVFKGAKGEIELKTVVQLVIDTISEYPLDLKSYEYLSDLEFEICTKCGYKKYNGITKGKFPAFLGNTDALIFKTQEYFGSGGSAWQETIISPELYRVLYDNDLTEQLHFEVLSELK